MPDLPPKSDDLLKHLSEDLTQLLFLLSSKAQTQLKDMITQWLDGYLPKVEPEVVEILNYSEVIDYFVKDKPTNLRIVKGAILRASHPAGELITQVYLDEDNHLVDEEKKQVCGRRLIAKKLDKELEYAFAGKSMIIVE